MKRIELEINKGLDDFIKENEMDFWELTIEAIKNLSNNDHLDSYVAFTLYGGLLKEEEKFVIKRKNVIETINKALIRMEDKEEYEKCAVLLELSKKFQNN